MGGALVGGQIRKRLRVVSGEAEVLLVGDRAPTFREPLKGKLGRLRQRHGSRGWAGPRGGSCIKKQLVGKSKSKFGVWTGAVVASAPGSGPLPCSVTQP